MAFERKASQLTKYDKSYCGQECKAVGLKGPKLKLRTGEMVPCEACGTEVWRTPATLRPRTYCSHLCAVRAPRTPRVERVIKPCATCEEPMVLLPSEATRYRYCSWSCAAKIVQGAKRGKPGAAWSEEQRAKVSATLRRKYQEEWAEKAAAHSTRMSGSGNPQWQDGQTRTLYAPGFTAALKARVAKRDRYMCRLCDAPRGYGTHAVHHIDHSKTNHDLSNLILLCRRCHGLVHQGSVSLSALRIY